MGSDTGKRRCYVKGCGKLPGPTDGFPLSMMICHGGTRAANLRSFIGEKTNLGRCIARQRNIPFGTYKRTVIAGGGATARDQLPWLCTLYIHAGDMSGEGTWTNRCPHHSSIKSTTYLEGNWNKIGQKS